MLDCNVGAKQSLDLRLIPRALGAGAERRDLCAVETVEPIAVGYAVRFRDALRSGRRRAWSWQRARSIRWILFRSSVAGGLGKIAGLGQHASLGADTLAV